MGNKKRKDEEAIRRYIRKQIDKEDHREGYD